MDIGDDDRLEENPLMTPEGKEQILELCQRYQMSIPSLTGDFLMQKPFFKSLGQEREDLFGLFLKVVETCGVLGIHKIIFPLVDHGRIENIRQQESLLAYLDKASGTLGKKHVQVCFELDMPTDAVCSFMRNLSEQIFAVNYDIGNSASLGYDYQLELNDYGSRVANVHVKDRLLHGSTVPLGKGNANIGGVIHLLEKRGYKGNYILQTARSQEGMHLQALCLYRDMVKGFLEN